MFENSNAMYNAKKNTVVCVPALAWPFSLLYDKVYLNSFQVVSLHEAVV